MSLQPPTVRRLLMERIEERRRFTEEHGKIKSIISAEVNGLRYVATGKHMNIGRNWQVFPDFLISYLAQHLSKKWGDLQLRLPLEQQHPAALWYSLVALNPQHLHPAQDGLYQTSLGAMHAWLRLAYDLYLIEHNAELHKRLIKRLRNPAQFQGARFEIAVAAMMLVAGYDLRFAEEKGPGKHPEFFATNRETGKTFAVEAKSKHRPGILAFGPPTKPWPPPTFGIDGLLKEAAEKDTEAPLLIFIELTSHLLLNGPIGKVVYERLNHSWVALQARSWPNGFPSIGVVFYNDVSPWYLNGPIPKRGVPIWGCFFRAEACRHPIDANPLLEGIAAGCLQRCNIPEDFPRTSQGNHAEPTPLGVL